VSILWIFVAVKTLKQIWESYLAALNRRYYENRGRQVEACERLNITPEDFQKTLAYSRDKYRFGMSAGWIQWIVGVGFIAGGGLGAVETIAKAFCRNWWGGDCALGTGLLFFGILGFLSMGLSLPFSYWNTFWLEEKHGFNRQTPMGFWLDQLKGMLVAIVLGGLLLSGLLAVMTREGWWIWAWGVMSGFSLLAMWIYPTFLAPLFNTFSPLQAGPLREAIFSLAERVGFQASGLFVMDASRRSSHGNAYFTGLFGKKRIVLFDTLLKDLDQQEVVAVLAHELGHFKLHHVRYGLIRSLAMTGGLFFLMSRVWQWDSFYQAFYLSGVSNYGALLVFSLWFGVIDIFLTPMESWLSRKNEFAADAFAARYVPAAQDLRSALLKLRESNHAMPISHPWFSFFYYSHPPLLERLRALPTHKF